MSADATSLADEFVALHPQPSPALLARLADLDALPEALDGVRAALDAIDTTLTADGNTIDNLARAVGTLTATVARIDAQLNPPPPPPPIPDTVHVGPAIKVATLNIGWAVVQDTDLSATTAAILDQCAAAKKMHLIAFGPDRPIQTVEGGPIDFAYHDKIFGFPNRSDGYFGANGLRVLTAYGCPPYMRVPKPGTAPMPIAPNMALYAESPPHWSHHDNYAKLLAAFVDRYQIDVLEDRNEWKGESVGTPVAGSVMVPPGSGLPLAPGPAKNRWLMEHHTDRGNWMWRRVKEVRPECKLAIGYMVTRTYADPANPDSANDAFPMLLNGPWGNADKKAMQAMMYVIEHSIGFDYLCLDTKTSVNDGTGIPGGITPANQWAGLQKVLDWEQWFNDLADYDPAKYGRAKDCPTWYAEAYSRLPGGLTANNHQEAVATDAWEITNYIFRSRAAGWMRWQTEGNRKVGVDPASAHSIALVYAKGSPKSLQPTEAVPVYAGLVEHFPPGTQLYSVYVNDFGEVSGIASDTTICLVSRSDLPQTLTFKGEPLVLAPYDVRFIAR